MNDDRLDLVMTRLAAVEARLDAIERRFAPAPATPPPPPPIIAAPARVGGPPPPPAAPRYKIPTRLTPPAPTPAPKQAIDAEYLLGAKVLPRAAAAVLVMGFVYLVSYGVQQGMITPAMLFGGVCLLCLAFIGLGFVKRNEKEEFGQILAGIGSCGLYLNFAAGHVFQKLYGGEVLVGLFVLLSLANLGYSFARASKAFLAIGVLGGLAAAMMPLREENYAMAVGLHFLILVPAVLICARHKWAAAATGVYGVATLAVGPLFLHRGPWEFPVIALGGTALLSFAAYAWAYEPQDWDPKDVFPIAMLYASALLAFGIRHERDAWIHESLLGLMAFGLGAALNRNRAARHGMVAGLAIPLTVAPFGFTPFEAMVAFMVFGATAAVISRVRFARPASVLAGVELSLATAVYLYLLSRPVAWGQEAAALTALGGLVALTCYALVKAWGNAEPLVLGAAVLFVPLVCRLATVALGSPGIDADWQFSVTLGLLGYGVALVGLTYLSCWDSAATLLGAVLLGGLGMYGVLADHGIAIGLDFMLATMFCLLVAATGHVTINRASIAERENVVFFTSAIIGALVVRLSFLVLTAPAVALSRDPAISLGCSLVAILAVSISLLRKSAVFALLAALYALPATIMALGFFGAATTGSGLAAAVVALVSVVGVTAGLFTRGIDEPLLDYLVGLASWSLLTRISFLALTTPAVGLSTNSAVTIGWIVSVIALLAVGFARDRVHLRFSGLAVVAATVLKVMAVDLASTNPALRVAILMALGLTMLAGGYLYIRLRRSGGAS